MHIHYVEYSAKWKCASRKVQTGLLRFISYIHLLNSFTGETSDPFFQNWQFLFISRSGVTSFVNIQRQFFDGFVGQTFKDVDKLVGGYILVFVYVNLMLSKMNFVEQRVGLSIVGILRYAQTNHLEHSKALTFLTLSAAGGAFTNPKSNDTDFI